MGCDDELRLTWCSTEGLLAELVDTLEARYNFTVETSAEPDNFWGTTPVRGSHDEGDVDYGGVMGGVFHGDYDMALSVWGATRDRTDYFDFATR